MAGSVESSPHRQRHESRDQIPWSTSTITILTRRADGKPGARSGERVVLTVRGRPVADIVPRRLRSERRPTERLLADLEEVGELAAELDVASSSEDYDVGLTTDDM